MPKDFDLELAKQGHPLVTRDGRKVLAFAFFDGPSPYPAVAVVEGCHCWWIFTKEGHNSQGRIGTSDLLLADLPEIEETAYMIPGNPDGDFIGHLYRKPTSFANQVVTIRRPGEWKPPEKAGHP